MEGVKTAVASRAFAQLSPDDEFRLEASKTHRWLCFIFRIQLVTVHGS